MAELKRQMYLYMRGHVAALLVQFERHRHTGNIRRVLVSLPMYYLRRLRRMVRYGGTPDMRTFRAEITGCAAGVWFYLRSPAEPRTASNELAGAPRRGQPVLSLGDSARPAAIRPHRPVHKAPRRSFLASNPFPAPRTLGFFYREKMRAIHRIAPDEAYEQVLEIGGGQGGLTALLYPRAQITNLDVDPAYADAPVNKQPRVRFITGDATALPFENESFDAVTMFDVLEHVPDDGAAVTEALRVLRPDGALMVSTPNEHWRFPYYAPLRRICPSEEEMFAEWGHQRRGYALRELRALIGLPCARWATFINPVTVVGHDISFSRLSRRRRRALVAVLAPITWLAYAAHRPRMRGTETASAWRKPAHSG